jgi:hypothetical protein
MTIRSRDRASHVRAFALYAWALLLGSAILIGPVTLQPAFAQTTAPRTAKPAAEAKADSPTRPKRERSPAQKANDDRMRACGAEWRTRKAELSAKGETWRKFSVDCRARLKARGA